MTKTIRPDDPEPSAPQARPESDSVPMPAAVLTAAGALPFMFLAAAVWFDFKPFGRPPSDVLALYALAILSFMGAIHWGLAMSRSKTDETWSYVASVVPALGGWFALAFLPQPVALRLIAVAFAVLLLYDVRASRLGIAPAWYPILRVPVTILVAAALAVASFGR